MALFFLWHTIDVGFGLPKHTSWYFHGIFNKSFFFMLNHTVVLFQRCELTEYLSLEFGCMSFNWFTYLQGSIC